MLQTNDSPVTFLHWRAGSGTIGFDGMGAIDFSQTDFEYVARAGMESAPEFSMPTLQKGGSHDIVLRRGVKPFDLAIDRRRLAVLVRPEISEISGNLISHSTNGLTEVTCHFGKRNYPYLFGNVAVHDAINKVCWSDSLFHIADGSSFLINQTRIEEGSVPPDNEVTYIEENVRFESERGAYKRSGFPERFIPVQLSLHCRASDIINLDLTHTLISQRLYDLIQAQIRPKYRVSGVNASRPLTTVQFLGEPNT
jgi:hypothetical protein